MRTWESFKMALSSIGSNKFRTFLTLLGIIIGVASVIIMVSLGSGTQMVVSGQFSSINTRQILLTSNYELDYNQRIALTLEDVDYILESTHGIDSLIPFVNYYFNAKYQQREQRGQIMGTLPNIYQLSNVPLQYGRFFDETDLRNREKVVVVGEGFLSRIVDMVDYSSLIGEYLEIEREKFMIVGILGRSNTSIMLSDQSVVIPLSTSTQMWNRWNNELDYFLITYGEQFREQDIIAQLDFVMNAKYGKTSNGKNRFTIQGLQQQVDIITRVLQVFTYVLAGIAAISLLVGGIGVMNIMLVSVKERTREIGIRIAIGATQSDVQSQFLLEAIIMSVSGGIIGIILGGSFSALVNLVISQIFEWWEGSVPFWIILTSFGFTVAIGVIFGFYPAYKASKLDPIEALRYS